LQLTVPVEAVTPSVSRHLPVLLLLFACGGCSALIYEVAWHQVLQLVDRNPLRVYAALEFRIAFFDIAVALAMALVARAYIVGAEHGMPGMLLRGAVA
jgi:hypothetical protein